MTNNGGSPRWLMSTVRFLIGLPTATAYFYVRHFSTDWACAFLALGLAIMVTGLLGHDSKAVRKHAAERMELAPSPLLSHERMVSH